MTVIGTGLSHVFDTTQQVAPDEARPRDGLGLGGNGGMHARCAQWRVTPRRSAPRARSGLADEL